MISRGRRATLGVLAAALLLLIGGRLAAEFVVELLWYRSLGYERSFWTLWGTGLGARAALSLPVGLAVFGNLWIVARSLGTLRVRRRYANIEIAEQVPRGYIVGALLLISLLSAWWLTAWAADPIGILSFLRHGAWGTADPVFGRDLAYYVFRLPFLERLQTLAGVLVFWIALLVSAAYVATGAVRFEGGSPRPRATPLARRHLSALLGAFLLVVAVDAWLDRYNLLLRGSGVGDAPGYTDLHALLPGKAVVAAFAVIAAAAVVRGGWVGSRREPLAGLGLLLLAAVGTQLVYPALVQKLTVEPNQFPRERPYIETHLDYTRLAYGLSDLRRVTYPYQPPRELSSERLLGVLQGVPLWDERPLLQAYAQKQGLFPYYEFNSVHSDRYGPPGGEEQVAVAVRELEPGRLSETAMTWQNLHLTYVSGEGAVVGPMAEIGDDGAPLYYLYDLDPPKLAPGAPEGLQLTQPAVFFGERTRGYVILDPDRGATGVRLGSGLRKLVFAWAFQSKNLFLSDEITPDSRIVYRRQILDRARALAPFLTFLPEGGALPVIDEGRVLWIIDGYTASATFPFSRDTVFEGRPVSYLRNSAKVTVDGVTGEVRVYAVDAEDPMLRTYARILPGVVRPADEMPPGVRRHLRVPRAFFALQAQVLGEYHMTDPRAFYSKEDVWARAMENYQNEAVPLQPLYSLLPLPGEGEREYLLSVPLVSRGRQNMTALLVARNDPPHYGEQILLVLPRDELVPGPQQVEAMIDQNPEISQQLSLWRQGGSDVVRGHLVVVPLDSTLVYVEPLFLVAENAAIPQLERVILSTGREVAMRPSLGEAVAALLDPAEAAVEAAPPAAAPEPREDRGPDAAEILGQARQLLEQAEAQLRAGDWASFGRSWTALRELLRGIRPADPPAR